MTVDRPQAGFTLIEMLVALAVFAIAALALMRLDIFAVAQASALSDARLASLVVQNEGALALTDPRIMIGETRSEVVNGGSTFDVVRRVTPTADVRIVRIDVAALQRGGRGRAVVTFVKRVA
jgi:general secretion pathway protein I